MIDSSNDQWIYIHNADNTVRYVLGTKGEKPLFCFGINPSTATPDDLDPTIRKVECIAKHNGYDSFIMLNVYPKRDTVFEDLEAVRNDAEHLKNIEAVLQVMSSYSQIEVWVAFGNHIYDRQYLPLCLKDIFARLPQEHIRWYATAINKSGAPKHPLYQKNTAQLQEFDMRRYIETL